MGREQRALGHAHGRTCLQEWSCMLPHQSFLPACFLPPAGFSSSAGLSSSAGFLAAGLSPCLPSPVLPSPFLLSLRASVVWNTGSSAAAGAGAGAASSCSASAAAAAWALERACSLAAHSSRAICGEGAAVARHAGSAVAASRVCEGRAVLAAGRAAGTAGSVHHLPSTLARPPACPGSSSPWHPQPCCPARGAHLSFVQRGLEQLHSALAAARLHHLRHGVRQGRFSCQGASLLHFSLQVSFCATRSRQGGRANAPTPGVQRLPRCASARVPRQAKPGAHLLRLLDLFSPLLRRGCNSIRLLRACGLRQGRPQHTEAEGPRSWAGPRRAGAVAAPLPDHSWTAAAGTPSSPSCPASSERHSQRWAELTRLAVSSTIFLSASDRAAAASALAFCQLCRKREQRSK